MKQTFILVLATALSLASCQTAAPVPTSISTATQTFPPTPTATITLAPTPEMVRVGGVIEDGLVRYTSKMAGISFSLPVEWLCVNVDEDLYEASLAAAQASLPDNPGLFSEKLESITWMENNRLYCFIPDVQSFESGTDLGLFVQETMQLGFDNILDIVDYEYGETYCEVTELILDGRQAAFSKCQMLLPAVEIPIPTEMAGILSPTEMAMMFPTTFPTTYLEHYYDILDGGRYITLHFRGTSSEAELMASYEQVVLDSFRFEP